MIEIAMGWIGCNVLFVLWALVDARRRERGARFQAYEV